MNSLEYTLDSSSASTISAEKRMQALLSCDPEKLSRLDEVLFGPKPNPGKIHPSPVSISRAAELLGKSRSTLHRWINTGAITVIKIPGGNPLVPWSEVARLAGGAS